MLLPGALEGRYIPPIYTLDLFCFLVAVAEFRPASLWTCLYAPFLRFAMLAISDT